MLFFLAIIVKVFFLYLLGGLKISPESFVIFYNPISSFFILFSLYKKSVAKDKIFFVASLDIFMPVFGFLGLSFFYFLKPIFNLVAESKSEDVYELPFGQQEFDSYTSIKKTLLSKNNSKQEEVLYETLELEPYMEVFSGDNLAKKVNAIEKLTELSDPFSIRILKKCLDERDYEVRYFANAALGKIEQNLMTKIESAKENVERHPSDFAAYNMRALGYMDAFLLGILDSTMELHFLECSLMDYLTSLSLNPEQSYLYVRITQIYLILKRYEDLISLAKIALEADIIEEDIVKIKFYLAEASYIKKDFASVEKYCSEIRNFDTGFDLINNSVRWWVNEKTA